MQYYWPPSVPRQENLIAFLAAFQELGYFPCKIAALEKGFEKVAIYVSSDGKPTHAARQLPDGKWTSKLGTREDIQHKSLKCLEGSRYGEVAAILRRNGGHPSFPVD